MADGSYLTAADIDSIIQQMASYASREGIALISLDSVRRDDNLLNLVASSWQS